MPATEPATDLPPPPDGLSDRALELWHEVLEAVEFSPAELRLWHEALHALDLAAECRQVLASEGLTTSHATGATKAHPLLDQLHRARSFYAAAVRQLGLQLVDEPEPDPLGRRKPGPKPTTARQR